MAFGLIIIGDEILSGKRADRHFEGVRKILAARGLGLAWVTYLGDDRERLTQTLARTFTGGDAVFSCGGIGATPDDHTRQAAARALGRPLEPHPEALRLITERIQSLEKEVTPGHLRMGEFPLGAEIIPNPYNRIPGFSILHHWFVPGFPDMAWPMIEWVLDTHYAHLFHAQPSGERAMLVYGLAEATLTPLMEQIERDWPGVKVFSLPRLNPQRYEIELGVKGPPEHIEAAFELLRRGSAELGGKIEMPG
ncbi:MAG: molybdopterin-binding protein [Pseudomonadota bacterium]